MLRYLLAAVVAVLPMFATGCAHTEGQEQALVDRATLTLQDMMTQTVSEDPKIMLQKSRAVLICPRVFKAGFFAGAEGGSCVLLARAGNETWSYPAFYGLSSGSFGFQFGVQDAQLLLLILTDKGLNAVLDSQFKFGANASIAIATIGAGVQGSTTAAVGADIVAFSATRGLFGGVALEGSILSARTEWNQRYYGQPFAARQIVIQMQGVNPGADPLRQILTRYGVPAPAAAQPASAIPMQQGPGYAPAYPSAGAAAPPSYPAQPTYPAQPGMTAPPPSGGRGPIQEQPLSVPPR
ncbi:MAG: lipid-binding SYLF domain-containing protein [Acetobacteraceae bacterium]